MKSEPAPAATKAAEEYFDFPGIEEETRRLSIANLAAIIDRHTAPQWRDIESAPRDGTHILCHVPDDWSRLHGAESLVELWWDHDLLGWHNQRMGLMRPTHWMPKPPEPQTQEGGGKIDP